jgi:hypothetical protein
MTAGTAIFQGYTEVASIPDAYVLRRPLLHLLWCLEFAEGHPSAEHQALTDGVCAELGIPQLKFEERARLPFSRFTGISEVRGAGRLSGTSTCTTRSSRSPPSAGWPRDTGKRHGSPPTTNSGSHSTAC